MKSFFDWFAEHKANSERDWLILGKGPTFAKLEKLDSSRYHLLSLNHVVREKKVRVAHLIDAEVVDHLGDALVQNAEFVVMPWQPHFRHVATLTTLEGLVKRNRALARLNEEGRLLWYNLRTGGKPNPESSHEVNVVYFSAEAAIDLLATAGARIIRTLGVDGGAAYATPFSDLDDKTLLANGRKNFDAQFGELAKVILRTGVDLAPLDVPSPVRVFVGSTPAQGLAVAVLEHSIRKHASLSVEVTPLHEARIEIPEPKDARNRPRTPFTFQRFLIPQLCGFSGRAIYLDSDMQVFRDIRGLWDRDFQGASLLTVPGAKGDRRPQFSVMLLDCSALTGWKIEKIVKALDDGELDYGALVHEMRLSPQTSARLDSSWNCLERFDGQTALLHYTDMNVQPWVSTENRLGKLWCRELLELVSEGRVSLAEIERHVAKGWVRPSLLYQAEHGIEDPRKLPGKAKRLDIVFRAPFERMPSQSGTLQSTAMRFRAIVRKLVKAYES